MAPKGEKEAWLDIVEPEDLDEHMANIGQAEANAGLIKDFFRKHPLTKGKRLLVHGCGTCQMLDYLNPADMGKADITFADIAPKMLESAKRRAAKLRCKWEFAQDDIENTKLSGKYDAALLVLVLLHTDWKKSLDNLISLGINTFYIIEQEQDPGKPSVTKERQLPKSIRKYSEVAEAGLIPRSELTEYLRSRGYRLAYLNEVQVPDNKTMAGLVYKKA